MERTRFCWLFSIGICHTPDCALGIRRPKSFSLPSLEKNSCKNYFPGRALVQIRCLSGHWPRCDYSQITPRDITSRDCALASYEDTRPDRQQSHISRCISGVCTVTLHHGNNHLMHQWVEQVSCKHKWKEGSSFLSRSYYPRKK